MDVKSEIISCIKESMADSFSELKIEFSGANDKGEGYLTDFFFATVSETSKENDYKEVYLAIKVGKRDKEMRENLPVIFEAYRREAYVYDKVLTTFRAFQLEKNVVNTFEAFPKCYQIIFSDTLEALVLENLKKEGFTLHNRKQPMNSQHIRLVLKNYAKFHALSFAFRDQHEEKFNQLTANYYSIFRKMISTMGFTEKDDRVTNDLREAGRDDLADKCQQLENDRLNILQNGIDDVPSETVITHGDCHNNNFLFKYQGNDKENPIRVAIIDWQVSELHSPVTDLCYFLYFASNKADLAQLDVLLKYYHSHLSDFLKELGSDAERLFPYKTLVEHWKKYSVLVFLSSVGLLKLLYVDEKDAPSAAGFADVQKAFGEKKLTNVAPYTERLIYIVDHHFNYILN